MYCMLEPGVASLQGILSLLVLHLHLQWAVSLVQQAGSSWDVWYVRGSVYPMVFSLLPSLCSKCPYGLMWCHFGAWSVDQAFCTPADSGASGQKRETDL